MARARSEARAARAAAAQLREELRGARRETETQAHAHHTGFRRRASRSSLHGTARPPNADAAEPSEAAEAMTRLETEQAKLRAALAEREGRETELLAANAALSEDLAAAHVRQCGAGVVGWVM